MWRQDRSAMDGRRSATCRVVLAVRRRAFNERLVLFRVWRAHRNAAPHTRGGSASPRWRQEHQRGPRICVRRCTHSGYLARRSARLLARGSCNSEGRRRARGTRPARV